MKARTVSDCAVGVGTSSGALLQTLVAQKVNASTCQGGTQWPETMLPPSVPNVGFALKFPVVQAEGALTVMSLRGEADISTRHVLSDVLSRVIGSGTGGVVIDLAEVTFIDTSTVRALSTAQRLLDRQDRSMTIRSPSRLASRVLDLFGLTNLVDS